MVIGEILRRKSTDGLRRKINEILKQSYEIRESEHGFMELWVLP